MPPENRRHYAMSKISDTARVIELAVKELPGMRDKLGKLLDINKERARVVYEDIRKLMSKLIEALEQCFLSLEEMDETHLSAHTAKLIGSLKSFGIMTPDYKKLCAALADYVSRLPCKNETANAQVIGRLMNRVKMGYYPTDLEHVAHIERAIAFPKGVTTNLFDPCCGCGLALRALADGNNCYAFGVELDQSRAEEAQTRLHRVGFGSYFYSRISHECFHAMLLNPPYLSVLSENGQNFRSEKRFLADSICHLMIGGLLVYIVPYYRLTGDICRVLCDNFSDISVWKFSGQEFTKFKQITVMGLRQKRRRDMEQKAAELASLVFKMDDIPELSAIPDERYSLPGEAKRVEVFKGAEFNVGELAEQLKNSNSFSKLFQKSKLDTMDRRPLLPLSIGQVGLIGGSGLINGLVQCDTPHIIKGRIVKETKKHEDKDKDSGVTTVTETSTNKMIFNVLTPQGFKSLS